MAELLEARFRIITPMFLGGADQDTTDGIRPPSVKGALRFWWRALNWATVRSRCVDDAEALRELHQEEARLFGIAASREGAGGQGSFLLRTTHGHLKSTARNKVHPILKSKTAARYLGYGLMEAFKSANKSTEAGQLTRPCIDEEQDFVVSLLFRDRMVDSVKDALIAWGLLGGLGSRARHGFGSLALQSLKLKDDIIWSPPANVVDYRSAIAGLLQGRCSNTQRPPFTAMSAETRIDILDTKQASAFDALDLFGRALLMYRSWGKGGEVLGQPSEQNFPKDHDWSKGTRPKDFHPRRIILGMPHNYGKPAAMQVAPEHYGRRASPLLLHVHPLGNHFSSIAVLLPATFLPLDEKINAGGKLVPSNPDWTVLTDFLDGNRADGKPRFPGMIRVLEDNHGAS